MRAYLPDPTGQGGYYRNPDLGEPRVDPPDDPPPGLYLEQADVEGSWFIMGGEDGELAHEWLRDPEIGDGPFATEEQARAELRALERWLDDCAAERWL